MRVLISQFRCSNCKNPVKSALVEKCPKCGKRLQTKQVSKAIALLIFGTILGLTLSVIILTNIGGFHSGKMDLSDPLERNVLLSVIGVFIIIFGTIIGYLFIKNKKRLEEDSNYRGTTDMVALERHMTYAEIDVSKIFFLPIVLFLFIVFLMILLLINFERVRFLTNSNFYLMISITVILLILFGITGMMSFYRFRNEIKNNTKQYWD